LDAVFLIQRVSIA